jgi:hypothetical protein
MSTAQGHIVPRSVTLLPDPDHLSRENQAQAYRGGAVGTSKASRGANALEIADT